MAGNSVVHVLRVRFARDEIINSLRSLSIIIIIIIIIKTAIYSKGDIFLSVSQITWIADNMRRAGKSHGMQERLQETPMQYTQWWH